MVDIESCSRGRTVNREDRHIDPLAGFNQPIKQGQMRRRAPVGDRFKKPEIICIRFMLDKIIQRPGNGIRAAGERF